MKRMMIAMIALTFTLSVHAQKKFEGSVTYGIEYKDLPAEMAAMEAMLPDEMTIRIKGDKSRIEQSMGMGMSQIVISDAKTESGILLMDMMGKKTAIEMSKEELEKLNAKKKENEPKIEYLDGSKEIAGYKCKKARILTGASGSIDVYYTDELPASAHKEFEGLKGFPLEYSVNSGPMNMIMSATNVTKEKLDKTLFDIPEGYEKQSFDEFQKSMQGMMGG
ncbi:MAG: DUF4412 domain-containing protein [Flavobacteriales bacterium]|nr:DUF4412 domain-containing protein [Flavobacteriales bacterium]